jgi:hypothetical protein
MSNKGVLILLISLVIIFGIILTCPNKEDHKVAVVNKVTSILKSDSVSSSSLEMIDAASNVVVAKIIETAVDNLLTVDNYFFVSLGTIKYDHSKRLISIGVLHHVFVLFSKDDLEGLGTLNGDVGPAE